MKFLIIYVVMTAFIAGDELLYAQETDDHKAIRALIDREQNANDTGDAQALLDVHSEDFIAVWARHYDGATDWLQSRPGYTYDDIKRRVSAEDWAGRSAILNDEVLDYKHKWEVVHIAIDEDDAVAVSQMEHARNDTVNSLRVTNGWTSLWMLKKLEGQWKFHAAIGPLKRYYDERPLTEE
jgi:hypothetical protein